MDYREWTLSFQPRSPWSEIVTALLAEKGFESFVETEDGIQAYAQELPEMDFEAIWLEIQGQIEANVNVIKLEKSIAHQNWNAVWEADFEPVIVEEYLSILAPFHDKSIAKGMLVEIQPQMSFGTGHHQTTYLMSKALFESDTIPDKVLDMGTGTGILAIVAEKLGAKSILAIDIEPWSAENAQENAERNECKGIEAICGDIEDIAGKKFGLILANINKNVLKSHLAYYAESLTINGELFLSGFFETDVEEILHKANDLGFEQKKIFTKENWAALVLEKKR